MKAESKSIDIILQNLYTQFNRDNNAVEIDVSSSEDAIRRASMFEDYTGKKQDREQRKKFSIWIFSVVCTYLAVVLTIIFLVGFSLATLSETVLVTLLTTTTANIIGLLVIVARYLFPRK